jgi:hypothetical protein
MEATTQQIKGDVLTVGDLRRLIAELPDDVVLAKGTFAPFWPSMNATCVAYRTDLGREPVLLIY